MAKSKKIKKADIQDELTPEQIQELWRCKQDPIYFAKKYVKIQHPTKGAIPFEMYDYQCDMINAYMKHDYCITLASRQVGKEQPHSAKIATPNGWTTMGEISPGDIVLTPNGSSAHVLQKFPQGVKDVYQITFDDGSFAECGIDHLWTVYIRNRFSGGKKGRYYVQKQTLSLREIIDYRNKKAKLKSSTNFNVRIPTVQHVNFNKQHLPVDPYLLGCLLGDGSLARKYSITFTTADQEIFEHLKDPLIQVNCIYKKTQSTKHDYNIVRKDKSISHILSEKIREMNLMGTKSHTKFIPKEYLISSHDQRLALLQGLMDTDGTVSKRSTRSTSISFCTTSPQLRDDVRQLVWSLGGRCSVYKRKKQLDRHKQAYDLFISLPNPKECFRLTRKKDLCNETWGGGNRIEKEIRRTIVDIKLIRQEESSCISIDSPDRLYITDNYTVTHNTVSSVAYLLWYACFNLDKTILIAANKNSTAMEIIKRIKYAYEELPMWLKPGVVDDGWNKHNIGFDNKSQIISTATSEDSGRGLSISLLYLDEFAFVKPSVQEEFWSAILPTLSTGGSCIISSTPNGDSDLFARLWRAAETSGRATDDGDNLDFIPIFVPWDLPPGRDEKFKQSMIAKFGEHKWKQEFECQFLSSDPLLIDSMILTEKSKNLPSILFEKFGFKIYKKVHQNETYLVAVDPASGTGRDYSVIEVFSFPELNQVAEYRSNTTNPNELYEKLMWFISSLDKINCTIYFSIENNGVGSALAALYMNDENIPNRAELISETGGKQLGFNTNVKTKLQSCINLKNMIEGDKLIINSPTVFNELKNFVRKKGSYEAQTGSTDDCISACLIMTRIVEELASYEDEAFNKLYEYNDIDQNSFLTPTDVGEDNQYYDEDDEPPPIVI